MPLTDAQREHIVEVAETWYGTPYHGHTCLKGVGADCGQLIKGVFTEAGHQPPDGVPTPKDYSLQVWQHKADTTYIDTIAKYFREITEAEVKPGDVVCYQLGRHKVFAHAAIIKAWPSHIIHSLNREGVHAGNGMNHKFAKLKKKFFTLKEDYC